MKHFILSITVLIVFFTLRVKANSHEVDSLINLTNLEKNDSILLNTYNEIGHSVFKQDQQLGKKYWQKAYFLAEKFIEKDTAESYKVQYAEASNGMGIISRREGNYALALEYYHKCLNIEKEIRAERGGNTLMNIGVIYREMENYEKALEYVGKGLAIAKEMKDSVNYAANNNVLGMVYRRMKDYDKALECYNESLEMSILINDKDNIAQSYNNIGAVYYRQNKVEEALVYLKKAFQIHLETNNQDGIVRHHQNLISIYNKLGDTRNALKEARIAYKSYTEMGRNVELSQVARHLSRLYAKTNNYEKAYFHYKEYITLKDSVFNEKATREVTQKEMQFAFDKQLMADSLARAEKERLVEMEHKQEIHQQNTLMFGGGIILLLVVIFSIIIFNRLKLTRRQKSIIVDQKMVVDQKNKEITDSINYAQRIQSAILPSIKNIKTSFPNSFVLYKPKDIVAGDFYWHKEIGDCILIAVADCTGHGVPGAMVSVVCNNALNRSVRDFNLTEPAKILDKTAELVIGAFKKHSENVKDGMDIALCSFNKKTNKLEYAGAINSMFHVSENELIEVKGDKQPIGQYANIKPFTNHIIDLVKGDTIYLFSDGYPDQFGGEKGKKYMYKRFRELLLDLSKIEFSKQKNKLDTEFNTWKGDLEQLDDVCVVGVRL